MAPIQLPTFINYVHLNPEAPSDPTTPEDIVIVSDRLRGVQLSTLPLDPPSHEDIVAAQVFRGGRQQGLTTEDLANAAGYEAQMMGAHTKREEAPPPWFEAAVNAIHDRITALETKPGKVSRISAHTHNRNLWVGCERLETVNFPTGEDPTATPYNLPPLRSVKAIQDLSPANCNSYYQGYYPNAPLGVLPGVQNMAEAIRLAIGGPRMGRSIWRTIRDRENER